MEKTLEYYCDSGNHIIFDKYTISTSGLVKNKKTGEILNTCKIGKYSSTKVFNGTGKRCSVKLGRALLSTFVGCPPTVEHTADHIDRNSNNDVLENLRWLCKKGQRNNQDRQDTYKSAFTVVKDGAEKTVKEWVEHFTGQKNQFGREYT